MPRRIFCKALLVAAVVFVLLAFSGISFAQGRSDDVFKHVKEVQERHIDQLLAIKGVEGTAIGFDPNDQLVVKIFAVGPKVAGIPKKLDGVPTHVVVTGKFYAFPKPDSSPGKPDKPSGAKIEPTARFPRPVPTGVSTGNVGECSAGTIACRVIDGQGKVYALSNNHVYALENEAEESSEILQPGLYDTRCIYNVNNVIGTWFDFEPIDFRDDANYANANTIDAAIALSSDANLGNGTPSNGYGIPKSTTVEAYINQKVQKYGRTTSLTKGTVTDVNAIIWITYSSGRALFKDQIIVQSAKPFIKAGDSGSLLVSNPGKEPVGLLFAGDASGKYAIANRIAPVLTRFGVTVDGEP
jgi:hypothetical protein